MKVPPGFAPSTRAARIGLQPGYNPVITPPAPPAIAITQKQMNTLRPTPYHPTLVNETRLSPEHQAYLIWPQHDAVQMAIREALSANAAEIARRESAILELQEMVSDAEERANDLAAYLHTAQAESAKLRAALDGWIKSMPSTSSVRAEFEAFRASISPPPASGSPAGETDV